MIKIEGLDKSFNDIQVLKDINLDINEGEIFGLVGHSGAGKSTLLRCLNGLESYNTGSVTVRGQEVKDLKGKEMRSFRKDLGMIFQHFSLLERKNVYDNIALPMECWGIPKAKIKTRVDELLKIVGLEDKAKSKPRQLSGGQKQRVAIARALALEPNILLCDEATSALDPKTTKSILSLLREINEKLGITIIIVTHQMEVVKEVCERVAILEGGEVLEVGHVEDLFLRHTKALKNLLGEEEVLPNEGVNIKILFPKDNSHQSIITSMARDLDIDFSIVWGKLERFRDDVLGSLVINVGEDKKDSIINYLDSKHVGWEVTTNE
jgi:D-methionine transport system ATP-binding protein